MPEAHGVDEEKAQACAGAVEADLEEVRSVVDQYIARRDDADLDGEQRRNLVLPSVQRLEGARKEMREEHLPLLLDRNRIGAAALLLERLMHANSEAEELLREVKANRCPELFSKEEVEAALEEVKLVLLEASQKAEKKRRSTAKLEAKQLAEAKAAAKGGCCCLLQ